MKSIRKLLARFGFFPEYCQECGNKSLEPIGYNHEKCLICERSYFCANGNLASQGKEEKYR